MSQQKNKGANLAQYKLPSLCETSSMRISSLKLKAMFRYFVSNTDSKFLGKVKLMKLFYFVDFNHVKRYGSPVTYDNYVHLEHGPVPSTILNLVDAVEQDIDNAILSDTIAVEQKEGSPQKRVVSLREFSEKDASYFSPNELNIMERVCKRFADKNMAFIEEAAKKEAPYSKTRKLENIPYTLALEDQDVSKDVDKENVNLMVGIFGK